MLPFKMSPFSFPLSFPEVVRGMLDAGSVFNYVSPVPFTSDVVFQSPPLKFTYEEPMTVETYVWRPERGDFTAVVEHWGPPPQAATLAAAAVAARPVPPPPVQKAAPIQKAAPRAPTTASPSFRNTTCYEMAECRGRCGNPLHTRSNVALAKAERTGDLWGDLI